MLPDVLLFGIPFDGALGRVSSERKGRQARLEYKSDRVGIFRMAI